MKKKKEEKIEQQLKLLVTVDIPVDKVLIDKIEYLELKNQKSFGEGWSMEQFARKSGWSAPKLKNILYIPTLKKKIDISQGGWVYYPKGKGDHWWFLASNAKEFIEFDLKNYL